MQKLLISPLDKDIYARELSGVISGSGGNIPLVRESELSTDYLLDNNIDVVVSNQLSDRWYERLRQLQIVSLTIGPLRELHKKCDIVVDCAGVFNNKYFTGPEYSVCDRGFDLLEVANLIHKLDFDSQFFGFPIAYVTSKYLTGSIVFRANKFIDTNQIKLVEYLCNCHDDVSVRIAEEDGYHFTDIRMSLSQRIVVSDVSDLPAGIEFRRATTHDLPALRELGDGLYRDSRYYFDGHFPLERINEFYKSWIEKAVLGTFDDYCYGLFSGSQPLGFCTLRLILNRTGRIGVFGVAPQWQGQGLGKLLLQKVLRLALDQGIPEMYVVTQGRNYAAQKLYQTVGFRVHSNELWYHKWVNL